MRFNLLVYVYAPSTFCSMANLVCSGLRSNVIKHQFKDQASPQERAYVSAFSGGISGGVVTRLMGNNSPNLVAQCDR